MDPKTTQPEDLIQDLSKPVLPEPVVSEPIIPDPIQPKEDKPPASWPVQNESFPEPPLQPEYTPPPLETPLTPTDVFSSSEGDGGLKKFLPILAILLLVVLGIVGAFKILPNLKFSKVTLTYWGLWETEKTMEPLITAFEKSHPNIKIVYSRQSPKQYRERLTSSLARGEGPDLFRIHNTWLPMFSRDLAPVPAKTLNALGLIANFYPVTADLRRGNQYYGIPLEVDGLGLYVNEDIFKQAGLSYPTTWEELRTTALKLTVKDLEGKITTSGVAMGTTNNVEHWSDILGLMLLQNGVDLSVPAGNLAEDALLYYSLFAEQPDNTWDETLDNSILAFAKGEVAMIFAPSWQTFEIKKINPGLNFKILPVPQLPGVNLSWSSYWAEAVWQKSKNSSEAFEFLQYLASREGMSKLFTEASKVRLFGEPYSRTDLGQTLASDVYAGAYISQAKTGRTFYMCSRTFDNGLNDKIIKYYEDALNSLNQGVSPEAALETAQAGIQQVLSTYGVSVSP